MIVVFFMFLYLLYCLLFFSFLFIFFFKQKTASELRIRDWISDVCSSDLGLGGMGPVVEAHGEHVGGAGDRSVEDGVRHTTGGLATVQPGGHLVQAAVLGHGSHRVGPEGAAGAPLEVVEGIAVDQRGPPVDGAEAEGHRGSFGQTVGTMCGIIAVLRRPVERTDLPAEPLFGALERGVQALRRAIDDPGTSGPAIDALAEVAVDLEQVAADLHGPRGVRLLLVDAAASSRIRGLDRKSTRLNPVTNA